MTREDLNIWYKYQKALHNGDYLEKEDKQELIRLNFLVMEVCHKLHNDSMLEMRSV
jgi:hypothetical protein